MCGSNVACISQVMETEEYILWYEEIVGRQCFGKNFILRKMDLYGGYLPTALLRTKRHDGYSFVLILPCWHISDLTRSWSPYVQYNNTLLAPQKESTDKEKT